MNDTASITPSLGYRLRVVRFGQLLTVVGFLLLAITLRDGADLTNSDIATPLILLGGATSLVLATSWRTLLQNRWADIVILLWCSGIACGILLGGTATESDIIAVALLGVTGFAAALLVSPPVAAGVALITAACYYFEIQERMVLSLSSPVLTRTVLYTATAALLLIGASGISRQIQSTAVHIRYLQKRGEEIDEREAMLDHLYNVSRAIGTGTDLTDVLPEIVGRVVTAIGARTGVAMIYQAEGEYLEVFSPIWVGGPTLRAEGYRLSLLGHGINQRVFTSGHPTFHNNIGNLEASQKDQFLTDLDCRQIISVPLRIEARTIGVLMLADKVDGEFNEDDVTTLESLAGPSALVLNQMMRLVKAREEGAKMAELAKLKTEFVSTVSHELRTPLTSIIGSLHTLQRPQFQPEDTNARELVNTAHRQANRLKTLIEDLLVVSRIDNQALPVRPQSIELGAFLDDIVAQVPGASGKVRIDVEQRARQLLADPDHLRRIMTNLVHNAIKYAPNSPIEILGRQIHTEVWLSVMDHGIGIPYDLHDHIFDRFTQVENHITRSQGGTGLGLSIVQELSRAMGGRVWFEPTVGGGATFTVGLPAPMVLAEKSAERHYASPPAATA